jgi:uridine kinase
MHRPDLDTVPRWSHSDGRPLVIGIGGGSGSGKTTIAEALIGEIGEGACALIFHDAYYRDLAHLPLDERAAQNFDHPDSLETELLVEHLGRLLAGRSVDLPVYDFTRHLRREETARVEPRPVVLVEGVLVLADPELRELFDLKIYVDTDADLRLMRRLQRDIRERGRTLDSVFEQYLETVRPMHVRYVEPTRAFADLVIPEGYNIGAVGTVLALAREFLREASGA